MTTEQTPLERLEDPKPDDVGAWVRCRVTGATGATGQVWSYGKTRRWRIIADGERYAECLAEHLMPIECDIAGSKPTAIVAPEPEAAGLW